MKRFSPCLLVVILILAISNSSWAQFPCNPGDSVDICCGADSGYLGYSWDLGFCDTLHVVPWPYTDTCFIAGTDTICINNPGENFPCFFYVMLLVTHDSNTFYWESEDKWVQDSIATFVTPFEWTRTNPSAYCSVSSYWNNNECNPALPEMAQSVFRDIVDPLTGDTVYFNWMLDLARIHWSLVWANRILDVSTDPPYFRMSLVPGNPPNRRFWEAERRLLATITFRVSDTMHVYIDSTFWPPANHLTFTRHDATVYYPRHTLPIRIWVGPPRIEVISPNGGEAWCVGETHDITWLSENFSDDVKIEYSTNGGAGWIEITPSTENDGVYSWTVENTPSTNCLVKISDAVDGEPEDASDAPFTIGESITVTFPNGGEVFVAGESLSITWNSTCFTGSVDIFASEDGGANWDTIVSETENDGVHQALIPPSFSTDQGLVKVSDSDDGDPSDQSDGFFTVSNFTIRAEPETLVVAASTDGSCMVILESEFGFNLPCTLTVDEDSLPQNTTYDFNPPTVVPTDSSVLTFHTDVSTPPGTSTIIITGSKMSEGKNGIEHSTQVVLIVTPPPDFTIEVKPETLTVTPGEPIDCNVILESLYGFSSPCTLALDEDSLPANTTYDFNPATVVPTDTSILTFFTDVPTPPGTSTIIITGSEMSEGKSGIEHSTQVILIVPPPDFTIETEPDTLPVTPGDSVECNVILESFNGFSSPCTLTLEEDSLPTNTTFDFNPATVVPTDTSILTFYTDESTPPSTRTIIITGSEMSEGKKGIEHSAQVVLIVAPPRIEVTSPNGYEHWCIGENRDITWSCEGAPLPSVKIEYSINVGTDWETIVDSTQNEGTYTWTIPDAASNSCLVKVSDLDGDPYDDSDNLFTIYLAGDVDANGIVDVGDIMYMINYLFRGTLPPIPLEAGDVNGDTDVDIGDVIYLICYVFLEGSPPFCFGGGYPGPLQR